MSRKLMWLCSIICLCFTACKKEKRYSTWMVNGDSFSSNDIEVAISVTRHKLGIDASV